MRNLIVLFIIALIVSCKQINSSATLDSFSGFRTQQIEGRDSLFVLYTVKEWGKKMWWTWAVRSDIFKLTPNDVEYFIGGTFYSPDKKKILVWVGEKMPNAESFKIYVTENLDYNKICPLSGDTIYSLSAIIGIRDSINQIWDLYPFEHQQVTCAENKAQTIEVLEQYYFKQMKTSGAFQVEQSGEKKGSKELKAFGYNLQDEEFWNKCWLFQKDTVGSFGLYPFQVKGYRYVGEPCTKESADPYNPPIIEYPDEILKLYERN